MLKGKMVVIFFLMCFFILGLSTMFVDYFTRTSILFPMFKDFFSLFSLPLSLITGGVASSGIVKKYKSMP